jgi:putative acetyltransferase
MQIVPGDLDDPRVLALLDYHVRTAREATAPGSAHALDVAALRAPQVSFWAVWSDTELLGVGALKRLAADHGEIKSMHTTAGARRQGVGALMLRHLIAEARRTGMTRVSLETGSWAYFEPARALYRRYGFRECPPFADYRPDPNSTFMTLELPASAGSEARGSR